MKQEEEEGGLSHMPSGCSCRLRSGAPSFCSSHWMPLLLLYRKICQGPPLLLELHMISCSMNHCTTLPPLPASSVQTTLLPNKEPQEGSGTATPVTCK
jgi:hypothetical protein